MKMSPRVQYSAAWRLATSHAHLWATAFDETADPPPTCVEIENRMRSQYPNTPAIPAPTLDNDNNVVHTTATGRTRWVVRPNGSVTIEIYRPHASHYSLRAERSEQGRWTLRALGEYHRRHLDALQRGVACLLDNWDNCTDWPEWHDLEARVRPDELLVTTAEQAAGLTPEQVRGVVLIVTSGLLMRPDTARAAALVIDGEGAKP
jgi:hypothetical protein